MAMTCLQMGIEAAALFAAVHKEAFADQGGQIWNEENYYDLLSTPGRIAFVAQQGDVPYGHIVMQVVAGEAEVLTICVRPTHQRQGVGAFLVNQAIDYLRGSETHRLFLEVREDNKSAIAFYYRCGFTQIGRRQNYYTLDSGEARDALVMSCIITAH